MKMLISKTDLDSKRSREPIPLECLHCGKTHYRTKNTILRILNGNLKGTGKGCYCSSECKNLSRKTIILVNCKNCGKQIEKIPSDLKNKHSFCSSSCSAQYYNKFRKIYKICLNCSNQYHSKQGNRTKYCSKTCQQRYQSEKIYKSIDEGKYVTNSGHTHTIRKYLIDRKGYICQTCKLSTWLNKPINLTVNHIDGNAHNNSQKNLELLCWNCHSMTHNFGRKNKNSTRIYRYNKIGATTQNRTETTKIPT